MDIGVKALPIMEEVAVLCPQVRLKILEVQVLMQIEVQIQVAVYQVPVLLNQDLKIGATSQVVVRLQQ